MAPFTLAALLALHPLAQLAQPTQPPLPAPRNPSILVTTADSTPGDSIRVILERDLSYGDRLDVIVLDSASRVALVPAPDGALDSTELAQYNPAFALRVARSGEKVQIALYNVARHAVTHHALFHVKNDSIGAPVRLQIHQIADQVEQWITGTRGIAATRIAYIYEGRVHIVDSDGNDDRQFPSQGTALSPSWHPRGTAIVYADLMDAGTQIGRIDLATATVHMFSMTPRGLNITPIFTPKGDSVVYATAGPHGSHLVIGSALGRGHVHNFPPRMPADMQDLAEPTLSPDGHDLAFVASRPSYPQVYTMHTSGRNLRLQRFIPYTPGLRNERTAPEWSPKGDMIAYQQQNHKFQIWVAQFRNGVALTPTRLTSDTENRDPSWAPDGRHLVMTSDRGGDQELWILDIPTGRWRQLTNTPGVRLAAWSPSLSVVYAPPARPRLKRPAKHLAKRSVKRVKKR